MDTRLILKKKKNKNKSNFQFSLIIVFINNEHYYIFYISYCNIIYCIFLFDFNYEYYSLVTL